MEDKQNPLPKGDIRLPFTEIVSREGGLYEGITVRWDGSRKLLDQFIIAQAPAPTMVVQPTVELAKRWSVQRLAPTINETPILRNSVSDPKSRDSGNTQLVKEFKLGGTLRAWCITRDLMNPAGAPGETLGSNAPPIGPPKGWLVNHFFRITVKVGE